MADQSRFILSRLFLAIPELQIDQFLLNKLIKEGLVSQDDLDRADAVRKRSKRYGDIASNMRGKTLIERLMLVAPEIMSVQTINNLRNWGLIDETLGNSLRVGLRAGRLLNPGNLSEKTAAERWAALGRTVLNVDVINLLRDLDNQRLNALKDGDNNAEINELLRISVLRGQQLRSLLSTGRISLETIAAARNANGVWGILTVVFEGLFTDRILRDAIRAGAISQERFELISALMKLGINAWKKGVAAIGQDSLEARMLLMSEGILSPEMIKALQALGIIDQRLARLLYPVASTIRSITRGKLQEHMTGIRYRVIHGEAPIKTFARVSQVTDKQILKLLAEAAAEARKEALRLSKTEGFGKLTRSAQQRLVERALHLQMRALWEQVGHLTIFGEKEAARAALASMDFLQDSLWNQTGKKGADYRRTIRRQSQAGIDSYISRQENIKGFSKRIYKNDLLARDLVSRRVNINLLRGNTAKQLADDISRLIRPGAPGGVSYNAMRLARTEINNAFHFSSIRYTREMPWVDGYRWNLSGSHGQIDVCNTMSQGNHSGLGRGVYKKSDVPGKPHPHCFCYITTVTDSKSTFERRMTSGAYDDYFKSAEKGALYNDPASAWADTYKSQADNLAGYIQSQFAVSAGRTLGKAALAVIAVR